MHTHANATTTRKQRRFIRCSPDSCRDLGRRFRTSVSTAHRWKERECPEDRSCRPHHIEYAYDATEEQLILFMRAVRFTLDELYEAVEPILPGGSRSSLYRVLVRHGVNRLPKPPRPAPGQFAQYEPGYLHLDNFHLPKLGDQAYCFVAIDRATRLLYIQVYAHKDKASGADFLERCLRFFPFKIHTILTDNGREFTLHGFRNRYSSQPKQTHPVDRICGQLGIEHRLTRPYTPKTNGLVERAVGLIKAHTTACHSYDSLASMLSDLQRWVNYYNRHRRHRRIGRRTPYQACCDWYDRKAELFLRKPTEPHLTVRNVVRLDIYRINRFCILHRLTKMVMMPLGAEEVSGRTVPCCLSAVHVGARGHRP